MIFDRIRKYAVRLATIVILSVSGFATAQAGKIYEINQIIDIHAQTPEDFYRFVPNYYWIEPGDTVRFNNTTGNHTVKSVAGIWPEGVQLVDIAGQDVSDIELTKPGVYGFRCRVHARHGMFALIIVGSPDPNLKQVSFDKLNDRGEKVFRKLFEKMEIDRKAHQQ